MLAVAIAAALLNLLLKGYDNRKKRIISDAIALLLALIVVIIGKCYLEYVVGGIGLAVVIAERLILRKRDDELE